MKNYVWSFILFNFYTLFFLLGFWWMFTYLYPGFSVETHVIQGVSHWDGHYLWKFFCTCVSFAISAFLAGALAKKNGGIAVLVSSVLISSTTLIEIYFILNSEVRMVNHTGTLVSASILYIATLYLSYRFGVAGERAQKDCQEGTIFDIPSYHFLWLFFPLVIYTGLLIYHTYTLLAVMYVNLVMEGEFFVGLFSIFKVLPIVVDVVPLIISYLILTDDVLTGKHAVIKLIASMGVLVLGFVAGLGLELLFMWLFN